MCAAYLGLSVSVSVEVSMSLYVCVCCVFLCLSVSSLCVIHLPHSIPLPFLPSSVPFLEYLQSFIGPDRVNNSRIPNQCACLTKRVHTVGGIRRRSNVPLWLLALSGYPVHMSAYPAHVSCVRNALPEAKVVF